MWTLHSVRRAAVAVVAGAVLTAGAAALGAFRQEAAPLPEPATSGGMTLNEALAKRRSTRAYADRALTAEQIGQLCWAAQGVTEPTRGLRTAPSAMTLYSVGVYVVDARGIHEYVPKEHSLRSLRGGNVLAELRALPPNPPALGSAPAVIVLGLKLAPLEARAGPRAERFALMEAGHVAQNVLLQATALGLGSIPVGGFDEAMVSARLKLPEGIRPVYLLPVGYPSAQPQAQQWQAPRVRSRVRRLLSLRATGVRDGHRTSRLGSQGAGGGLQQIVQSPRNTARLG